MRDLLLTIRGCWQLLLLAINTRFRVRGAYWQWRMETAFGAETSTRPSKREMIRAVFEYGRWVDQMKRMRR